MNVLLITYSFPPAAGVGVLRAVSLAKYLPQDGIHIDVLTARNAAAVARDAAPLAQLPASVAIHRTWTLDLPFALRKAIKKAISRATPAQPVAALSTGPAAAPARPNPIKRLLANLLLPDPQVGWLPFALPAARRLIRTRGIDVVLITVPPFSSVALATRLRRDFPTLPIVVDFRDEWLSSTLHLVSFNANARAVAIARQTESDAVRDASAIVCVTEAAVAELRQRYPGQPAAKFHCIPNGFDTPPAASTVQAAAQSPAQTAAPTLAPTRVPSLPPEHPVISTEAADSRMVRRAVERPPHLPSHSTPAPTTLTYIGTVYNSTDPAPVVEAILALPAELRAQLRLRFIGHIETPAHRQTLLRLPPAGVQLELIGFLPQAQALAYIAQTDYLLLITHDPINVAAKLYDYLGSALTPNARPILAAVHPTGDVRRILDRTRAGWSASITDIPAIGQLLTEAIARAPTLASAFHPDTAAIAAFHRRPLAARYATLLRTLVKAGAPHLASEMWVNDDSSPGAPSIGAPRDGWEVQSPDPSLPDGGRNPR